MSLLHARGLSLRYGPKVILEDASFAIGHHDRVGLIGPNGSGKSTLMKILAGRVEADAGAVQLVRRARAGYLPQELSELPPGSLIDGVLASGAGQDLAGVAHRVRRRRARAGRFGSGAGRAGAASWPSCTRSWRTSRSATAGTAPRRS